MECLAKRGCVSQKTRNVRQITHHYLENTKQTIVIKRHQCEIVHVKIFVNRMVENNNKNNNNKQSAN